MQIRSLKPLIPIKCPKITTQDISSKYFFLYWFSIIWSNVQWTTNKQKLTICILQAILLKSIVQVHFEKTCQLWLNNFAWYAALFHFTCFVGYFNKIPSKLKNANDAYILEIFLAKGRTILKWKILKEINYLIIRLKD